MTFAVDWRSAARRSMNSLPYKVVDAVLEFIYADLVENPHQRGHALRDELEGLHTGRRGDFRVIYRIDDDANVVTIEFVLARSDNYRSR
jgi:mRNA interferase RelE/StbE